MEIEIGKNLADLIGSLGGLVLMGVFLYLIFKR